MAKDDHIATAGLRMRTHKDRAVLPAITNSFEKFLIFLIVGFRQTVGYERRIETVRIKLNDGFAIQPLRSLLGEFIDRSGERLGGTEPTRCGIDRLGRLFRCRFVPHHAIKYVLPCHSLFLKPVIDLILLRICRFRRQSNVPMLRG